MTTISISGNSNDSNVIFNSASASIADSEKVSSLTDSHSGGNELEVWAGLTANGPECYIARLIDDELHILDLNDVIFKTEDYTTEGLNVNSIIFHPEFVKVDPNNYLDQMVNLGKKEKWNTVQGLEAYDLAYTNTSGSSDGKHYDVYEWDKTGTMGPIRYDKLKIITHRGLDGRRTLDVYYRVSEVITPPFFYGPGAWFNPGRVTKALLYYNNSWLPSPLPLKKNEFSINTEEIRIRDIFKNTSITLETVYDINRCFKYEFDAYIADASSNLTWKIHAPHNALIKSNSISNSSLTDIKINPFSTDTSGVVVLPGNEEVAWVVCSSHLQAGHFSLLVVKTPTSTKSSLFDHIDIAEVSFINYLKNESNKNLKLTVPHAKRICFNAKLALESMDN